MTTWHDAEELVKAYLKASPLITDEVQGRVFYSTPAGEPTYPLITLSEVSGVADAATGETQRISFDCWGRNKAEASDVKLTLLEVLHDMVGKQLDEDARCAGISNVFTTFLRDPELPLCRYVVDADVFVLTF